MPYTIGFVKEDGIVLLQNTGNLTYKECVSQAKEALELGRTNNTRFYLADCTHLVVQANVLEVFDFFPTLYEKIHMPRTVKLALLMSKDAVTARDMGFYETVCQNRGWQIKMLRDKSSAMKWLLD